MQIEVAEGPEEPEEPEEPEKPAVVALVDEEAEEDTAVEELGAEGLLRRDNCL
jgi:hypothetical protein